MSRGEYAVGLAVSAALALFGLNFYLGFALGLYRGELSHQREAVKKGHAEYKVNDDGKVTFHWKNPS